MNPKRYVLVTPRSLTRGGTDALNPLWTAGFEVRTGPPGQQPSADELLALLPGCVGYLAGVEPVTAALLEKAGELRVISRNGAGVDNVDLAAARRLGITVLRAAGANARGVAELTITLLLNAVRQVPRADRAIRAGEWLRFEGREVRGATLGIVGLGAIGREVLGLATGLGMRCVAYDPALDPTTLPTGVTAAELPELLAAADAVTLHAPPTEDGRPLIDAAALGQLKRGAVLINTARWALVDPDAVLAALNTGHLLGYATDTFATEPPSPHPLLTHERVILTPHLGGYTTQSVERAGRAAVTNLLDALASSDQAVR